MGEADPGLLDQREDGNGAPIGIVVGLEVDDDAGKPEGWDGRHLFQSPACWRCSFLVEDESTVRWRK